jgi:hypothetical protein
VYIAETTTGKLASYVIPWDRTRWNSHTPIQDYLRPVGMMSFKNIVQQQPNQK